LVVGFGQLTTSFRRCTRRDVDALSRRILQRVRSQIGHRQLRSVDRPDCATECLLVAALEVGNGLQTYSIAAAADDAGSFFQPAIQLARTGWLAEIEACGTNRESDCERSEKDLQAVVDINTLVGVKWLQSFLSADKRKTYCLYEAESGDAIREAARRAGLPADIIIELAGEVRPPAALAS
jgi:uncharacterized protein DUF4242